MRRTTHSILTVLATFALVNPLFAEGISERAKGTSTRQNPMLEYGNTDSISQQTQIGLESTNSAYQMLGKSVIDQDGKDIGEVRDMKIDTRSGRIDYVVVEKENALGLGESAFIPVPLGALSFTEQDVKLVVDKSKLDNVPSPKSMSEQEFQQGLHTHYGIAPTWQEERTIIHQEERKTRKP